MSQGEVIAICKDGIMTALSISAPFLAVSIIIGLTISILQAATQIHEQTITFVPKILATALLLIFAGSWMITMVMNFTHRIFQSINTLM